MKNPVLYDEVNNEYIANIMKFENFCADTKFSNIINTFSQNVISISKMLYNFSEDIDLDEYKYMFLMSILSFRMTQKFIVGSWGFSIGKTLDQLKENMMDFSAINFSKK